MIEENKPSWLKIKDFNKKDYLKTLELIEKNNLNTICVSANCPNRYECFSNNITTFLILGNTCTRNCKYCNVSQGNPKKIDENELPNILKTIKVLNLSYVVITQVSRDDLPDFGSEYFAKVIKEIKKRFSNIKIDALISDFKGDLNALNNIIKAEPDVINHNIEVVKDLFNDLRPAGDYEVSIKLLKKIKELAPNIKTKSGLMLGFGETNEQIIKTMKDLRKVDCDFLTIGQYFSPTEKHFKVKKFYSEKEFSDLKEVALKLGFKRVVSGSLIRSSYKANELLN